MDGTEAARLLLKVAAMKGAGAGRAVGRTLHAAGKTTGKAFKGTGRFGAEIAEGLGAGETGQAVGRLAAQGALAAGGVEGARRGKRKVDEFRYRHGLYSEPTYY